jgi:hypothetical protein
MNATACQSIRKPSIVLSYLPPANHIKLLVWKPCPSNCDFLSNKSAGFAWDSLQVFLTKHCWSGTISWKSAQWQACTIVRDINEFLPVISTFINRYGWNLVNRTYTQDYSIKLVWILWKPVQLKVCFTYWYKRFLSYFLHSGSDLNKIQYRRCQQKCLNDYNFVKIGAM